MTFPSIQNTVIAGEISPSIWGRTDKAQFRAGASTIRNCIVSYRGGAMSRPGQAYVGLCKQGAPNSGASGSITVPPRDINFQYNINQGYALEFGEFYMRVKYRGAYVVEAPKNITGATDVNPTIITSAAHGFANGDWLFITGMPGMLNNRVYATGNSSNMLFVTDDFTSANITVGNGPEDIVILSDGSRVFVSNSGDNTISVVDGITNKVIATINVGLNPDGMALTPDNSTLYVANFGEGTLSIINVASLTVTATIPIGDGPSGVVILPNGVTGYIGNFNDNTVIPITISGHVAGIVIPVGDGPSGLAAAPDSAHVYVTNFGDNTISVIETTGNTISATITVGSGPEGIVITPDGLKAYVANYNDNTVSVIDLLTNTVTATIPVSREPIGMAVSSDGKIVYVSNELAGVVSYIDTSSETVIKNVPVGVFPFGVQSVAVYSQPTSNGGFATLNGLTWIVMNVTTNTYELTDLFGDVFNASGFSVYTSGGQAERLYTVVSPYAAVDLTYLKVTQSANTMNLTCWNQQTNTEYPPYNLQRIGQTDWIFTKVVFDSVIAPPATVSSTATSSTTANTWYSYVVTAVDALGNESVASAATDILNNDISINAGSNTVTFSHVASAVSYNIYSATPIFTLTPYDDPGFVGVSYGFVGSSIGQQFIDTNIIRDFTMTPPLHNNPFARGQITDVVPTAAGTGYMQSTAGYAITTITGSDFSGVPVIQSGSLVGFNVFDPGHDYALTDTMAITGGTGATVSLTIGPETGTYPSTVQYYQQRLVYANTINQPDTYFMSQPGLYTNYDSSIPVVDSDAITGTPWGIQINGIQWMVPTINGLLTFTGNGVWIINGGNSVAITPSNQNAQAQAQIGCSAILPPLFINLHVLYVQAKNSIVRDVAYNFLYNVFQGTDITVFSNHLFFGHTLLQWAYAEEPFKVIWTVRDDGILLSLTYIKEQEVEAWSRHDTNGFYVGVCSVIEPPVDAIYTIVKRYIAGHDVWVYYSERADNRQWGNVEDCFCVDAGLSYPMTFPDATLVPSAVDGTNNISDTVLISGGSGYTSPTASAVDETGSGIGATFSVTHAGGIITAVTPILQGVDYTAGQTEIIIADPTGTGAIVSPVITNNVMFTASDSIFNSGMIDDIIRVDGGIATITGYISATQVIANITQPLTSVVMNDPTNMPVPAVAGNWSISTPISIVTGLNHLEGMTVTGLADGGVITPRIVTNGAIPLDTPASAINVGLGFTAQLQSLYLDPPAQTTTQGKRKNLQAVTLRLENSRGVSVGSNQPDQSTQSNSASPAWTKMQEIKERNALIDAGSAIPLFTGDTLPILIPGNWDTKGQVAIQQIYPLPMGVNAWMPRWSVGDVSG